MIIWSGFGIFGLAIPVLFFLGANWLANAAFGAGYTGHHGWPGAVGLLLSAIVVRVLGEQLNARGSRPTLFFVPLRFVAIVILVAAVVAWSSASGG